MTFCYNLSTFAQLCVLRKNVIEHRKKDKEKFSSMFKKRCLQRVIFDVLRKNFLDNTKELQMHGS